MPKRFTKFNNGWLNLKDKNGHDISKWCKASDKQKDAGDVLCFVCNKCFSCRVHGFNDLLQHATGKTHVNLMNSLLSQSTLTQTTVNDTSALSISIPHMEAMKSELIWSMKVVASNFTFNSCDGIKEVFNAMFPDSNRAKELTISSKKVSYLISEATGPHFHKLLLDDLDVEKSFYTILYDELSNKQCKKQLDLKIRYWSSRTNQVEVAHLKTFLMGHATGDQLSEKILGVLNQELNLKNLLMIESDGPNVNKKVWTNVNEAVKLLQRPGLIDIGSCGLHIVHNAFGKGIAEFGVSVVEFVIDLHYFFKLSPARTEDYRNLQIELDLDQHKFLKHVECRWLTLLPAINRVLEQWPTMNEYFLNLLPKLDKKISQNSRYKRIYNKLSQKSEFKMEVYFLQSTAKIFEKYLNMFQKEEPLIHLLYDANLELTMTILLRFLKNEFVVEPISGINIADPNIILPLKDINIGSKTKEELSKVKYPEQLLHKIKIFYCKVATHLIEKLPHKNILLKASRFLQPKNLNESWTKIAIQKAAKFLPITLNIDSLTDEWNLLQKENIPRHWIFKESQDGNLNDPVRIDHYWRNIFELKNPLGLKKYENVEKLARQVLSLAHGNADVERGFSVSNKAVTSSRVCLSEASINGLQATKDGLRMFGGKPHNVPLTPPFLRLGVNAHKNYQHHLDEIKKKAEQLRLQKEVNRKLKEEEIKRREEIKKKVEKVERNKKDLEHESSKLDKKENEYKFQMSTAEALLNEGNSKMDIAIKNKDYKAIALAHAMVTAAKDKISEVNKQFLETRTKQKDVEKRKFNAMDFMMQQAKKKKN